jgi:predicted negative regulator of RcsB-dependent stress response
MASPSVARRTPRSTIEHDDAVALRAAELAEWAKKNVRVILTVAAVLVVAVAVFMVNRVSSTRRAERAAAAYAETEQKVASGDSAAVLAELRNFSGRYGGTVEADQARLELASRLIASGKAADAVPVLRQVKGSSPVSYQATILLGAALASSGKRDEAVATYQRAADATELDYERTQALSEAALLQEQGGKWAAAAALYQRMLDMTEEGSAQRTVVELRLAEAQARAGTAAPRAEK